MWLNIWQQGKSDGFDGCNWPSNLTQIGFKTSSFQPVWFEFWYITLKNEYSTSSISHQVFQSHGWIKNWSYTQEIIYLDQITTFCLIWLWNLMDDLIETTGQLFYTPLSFVHHFKAIGEFNLELQSGNAHFSSKPAIFSCMTFKFDSWPW